MEDKEEVTIEDMYRKCANLRKDYQLAMEQLHDMMQKEIGIVILLDISKFKQLKENI